MILNTFLNALRDADYGDAFSEPTHFAVGTGTTAPTASDTTLETEIFPDGSNRSAISTRTKPAAAQVRQQVLLLGSEANGYTLTEFGVADAATGGKLKNRLVLATGFPKTEANELKIQIKTTYANGT